MRERVDETPERRRDQPALAVPPGADPAAVAATVVRAGQAGLDAVVAADEASDAAAVARRLGAQVLDVDPDDGSYAAVFEDCERAVRERGYPGLIRCSDPTAPIDVDASLRRLRESDGYAIDAVTADRDAARRPVIAIPAYEEAGSIADVVAAARDHGEVVVVDDGSDDGTATAAREAGADVVAHDRNRGYGAALTTAFREARDRDADALVVLDADGQHDPDDVPRLLETLRSTDADVVIGSRFVDGADGDLPLYRRAGIAVVNLLTNLSLGGLRSRVSDAQSGFRAYDADAVASLADAELDEAMGASTDILHHVDDAGYEIAEVPVDVSYDVEDANSKHPVAHGFELVNNLLRTVEQDHPVLVFGVPGLASVLLAVAFGYWTMAVYLANESFPVGLALTTTIFGLVGLLSCFTAVILHALQRHFD